ncbi:MAG: hypothetical protein ACXVZT_12505, partial [Terriglobales bacterium]
GSGSVSGMMDFLNTSQVASSQTIAGSYAVGDATNGRGTITFTSPASMSFAFYIVSGSEMFIIDSNPSGANDAPTTLSAWKQAASFPSPSGVSVLRLDGGAKGCSPGVAGSRVELDLLQWGTAGNGTVSGDENDCGTASTNAAEAFTYSVAANGRVTVAGTGNHPPVFYLVSSTEGFMVGTDIRSVESGFMEPQVGSNFNNASLSGNYFFGTEPLVVNGGDVGVGVVTLDGNGNVSGTSDYNSPGGLTTNDTFTDTLNVSANGRMVSSESVSYVISTFKAVMIDGSHSNTPKISVIEK